MHGELLITPPSGPGIARGNVPASGIGRNQLRGKSAQAPVFMTEIVIRHPQAQIRTVRPNEEAPAQIPCPSAGARLAIAAPWGMRLSSVSETLASSPLPAPVFFQTRHVFL